MRAFSSGNSRSDSATAFSDERQQPLQVDVGEVALLDPGDRRDLAVRARQVLEHLPLDAADRLAPAFARCGAGAARAAADVVLGDPALRPGARDRREVDAELLREPAHERRRAHLVVASARGRAARLRGGSARLRGSAVPADHDEHASRRARRRLRRRGSARRRRPRATGSRPSSCRSRSRRAGRPRRSPGPPATSQRAISPSVRPSPRSGSLNSYATRGFLPDRVVAEDRVHALRAR